MENSKPMLTLQKVHKQFQTPGTTVPMKVLDDISLEVRHGDSISIVGPSGSGKSTLLNLMGALDHPTSGDIVLNEKNLAQCEESELADIRWNSIGFIFQSHHLLPQCTVLENVLIPLLAKSGKVDTQSENRAQTLLERVGLADREHHRPGQLSGGECQRVAVVRALINNPDLILADEPTGSLDTETAEQLASLLIELNKAENTGLVIVTHDIELARQMEKSYRLTQGQLTEQAV